MKAKRYQKKITEQNRRQIKEDIKEGITLRQLEDQYGISATTLYRDKDISKLLKNRRYLKIISILKDYKTLRYKDIEKKYTLSDVSIRRLLYRAIDLGLTTREKLIEMREAKRVE